MSELADRPLRVKDEPLVLHWWRVLRWFGNLRLVPRWYEARTRIILRAVRRYYYDGLTRPGKILFITCLLTFLFSYRINSDLFLLTAALGFSLLAWSTLLGYLYRPRVSVQRVAPVSGSAGLVFTSKITVHNQGKRTLNNFVVREQVVPYGRWPQEWRRDHHLQLATGEAVTVPVSFTPLKRGRYQLSGVAVQSYFPFFLTRFTQRVLAEAEVYVLPAPLKVAVPSLRKVAEQASKRLKAGSDTARKGPSLDYAYSRPYQTGDSLRRLDHRAGSRLGQPMSKIFEGADEIRRDQVYLIVDLSLKHFLRWQRRPVNAGPLDARLALAVEIGLSAQNEGFTLAALATGPDWHKLEQPTQLDQHIAQCQPAKTPAQALEANARNLPETVINPDGLQILVLGRWSEEARAFTERCSKAGVLVLVFMMPETDADISTLPIGSRFVEIQLPAQTNKRGKRH